MATKIDWDRVQRQSRLGKERYMGFGWSRGPASARTLRSACAAALDEWNASTTCWNAPAVSFRSGAV